MMSRLLIACLILMGLQGLARADDIPGAPAKNANEVGVAVLSPQIRPDPVEQKLRLYLGGLPGIDYLLEPHDPDELFRSLVKLTRDGKKIRYLVIAGHGNAKAPSIKFRNKSLTAGTVDMALAQKRLIDTLELNKQENRLYDDPTHSEARVDVGRFLDPMREDWRPFHKALDEVSDVMAPEGVVLLLNCSAAATPAGKTMCKNLGQVLLGKRGGSVIASTRDIQIDQAYTWFSVLGSPRTGKWVTAGDIWVSGDWLKMDIPAARDPFLFAAFHPSSLKVARPGELFLISPQVDARHDSGRLQYSWNGGVLGDQSDCPVKVEDNPRHRIDVKVRVQDAQGRTAEDTFTVRIEAVQIVGEQRTRPGLPLLLKSSVIPEQKALTYRWSLSGRGLGSQPQLTFVPSQPGSYPILLEVSKAGRKFGSDTKVITVEASNHANPTSVPAPVDRATLGLTPGQLMVSDFFDLRCQLPPAIQDKVKRYEWLVQVGSGEGVPATTETPQVQLQLLREWQTSNFGVRLYDAGGREVDVAWTPLKTFNARPARFSFVHPSSWTVNRREDGSLLIEKKPTLQISDQLQESEGQATYRGEAGGGRIAIEWLSGDTLRSLTEGGNLPREWTQKGDVRQKGAVAFRAAFEPSGWLLPSSGGPRGSQLAERLTAQYQAAVTAHRDYTASQARAILASLKLTPEGEIAAMADPGPPKLTGGPDKSAQAAEKLNRARQELAQGKVDQAVSLADQAAQLDPKGSRQALAELAAALKKHAWEAAQQGKFGEARPALQGALKLVAGDADGRSKMAALDRAEKAWPRVQQLGQQVDELVQQRRLQTAYPLLSELIRLSNDLIYAGANMHPYTDGVNRRYHARQAEWNQFFRDTREANRKRYQLKDYRAVLDSIPALEAWELSPADQQGVASLRLTAQRGLDQQNDDWNFYGSVRSQWERNSLPAHQVRASCDRLGAALSHFDSADPRYQKINEVLGELRQAPLGVVLNAAELTTQVGRPVTISARISGGSAPYRLQWLDEDRPMTTTLPSNDWRFPNPGRFVVTALVTDSRQRQARATVAVVVAPVAQAPEPKQDSTSSGSSYAPNCQGDPFAGGRWNNAKNGSDWLQRNFASPRQVGEIRIERAGTDVTTEGSSIEIQVHLAGGNWVTVDRLQNTNINWQKLTGGRTARSVPAYRKALSPPLLADAVRLNLTGNGWFVAENIQILASSGPASPRPPAAASQERRVTAILRNESGQNVHLCVDGEPFGFHNRLTPGQQRTLTIQLPPDGRVRFQCGRNGQVLGTAIWNGDPGRYPQVIYTREEKLVILTGLR